MTGIVSTQSPNPLALFSYAVRQERRGETDLFDVVLHFVKVNFRIHLSSVSFLYTIGPELFTHVSPRAIILVTPHLDLERESLSLVQDLVPKWVAAVSVAPHTGEVARDVVDALLQIAANPDLRQLIPADVWLWLNERPSLPSESRGRLVWGHRDIFLAVRGLNNIEVLTSYLTLVWPMDYDGDFTETQMSVREDFNGIGVGRHRAELIQRVDDFLGDSDWEPGDHRRDQHEEIKRILRELDQEATEILNRVPHNFIFLSPLTPHGPAQNPARRSCVLCLSRVHNLVFGTLGIIPDWSLSPSPFRIVTFFLHSARSFGMTAIPPNFSRNFL